MRELIFEPDQQLSEETVTAIRKTRNLRDERYFDDYFFEEDLNNDPVRD